MKRTALASTYDGFLLNSFDRVRVKQVPESLGQSQFRRKHISFVMET
jgi:hypothetical protein